MLRVNLFRTHQKLFSGTAAQVVLPGEAGEVSVLDFHVPMLCVLAAGDIQVDEARFPVRGGIARVEQNVVTILSR